MAQRMVKAWRGVYRGHLKDVYITLGQVIAYAEKHGSDLPVPMSGADFATLGAARAIMSTKLAEMKPR